MRYYIRFGELPANERSQISYHGVRVGEEVGISVYHATKIDGQWHIVLPHPLRPSTIDTLTGYTAEGSPDDRVFLVTGTEIGTGCDGEPLLWDVEVVKELTNDFYNKKDKAKEYADFIESNGKSVYDNAIDRIAASEAISTPVITTYEKAMIIADKVCQRIFLKKKTD